MDTEIESLRAQLAAVTTERDELRARLAAESTREGEIEAAAREGYAAVLAEPIAGRVAEGTPWEELTGVDRRGLIDDARAVAVGGSPSDLWDSAHDRSVFAKTVAAALRRGTDGTGGGGR